MDPESFVRGGPTLTTLFFLVDDRIQIPPFYKRANASPPALNGIKMAFHWRAVDGPTLNAGLVNL